MAATVRCLLADGLGDLTKPAVAALQVVPSGLDVLLAPVQSAETKVHAHGRGPIDAWRMGKHDPKKVTTAVQIVVRGMPGEQTCLADFVQRQHGNRGVTLLSRPRSR
jgi:hypothetical protein